MREAIAQGQRAHARGVEKERTRKARARLVCGCVCVRVGTAVVRSWGNVSSPAGVDVMNCRTPSPVGISFGAFTPLNEDSKNSLPPFCTCSLTHTHRRLYEEGRCDTTLGASARLQGRSWQQA